MEKDRIDLNPRSINDNLFFSLEEHFPENRYFEWGLKPVIRKKISEWFLSSNFEEEKESILRKITAIIRETKNEIAWSVIGKEIQEIENIKKRKPDTVFSEDFLVNLLAPFTARLCKERNIKISEDGIIQEELDFELNTGEDFIEKICSVIEKKSKMIQTIIEIRSYPQFEKHILPFLKELLEIIKKDDDALLREKLKRSFDNEDLAIPEEDSKLLAFISLLPVNFPTEAKDFFVDKFILKMLDNAHDGSKKNISEELQDKIKSAIDSVNNFDLHNLPHFVKESSLGHTTNTQINQGLINFFKEIEKYRTKN